MASSVNNHNSNNLKDFFKDITSELVLVLFVVAFVGQCGT